jgi:hypothetical protein
MCADDSDDDALSSAASVVTFDGFDDGCMNLALSEGSAWQTSSWHGPLSHSAHAYDQVVVPTYVFDCTASTPVDPPDGEAPDEWKWVTTVLMRHLPKEVTQQMLADDLVIKGLGGMFDYLYVPMHAKAQSLSRGYAFINFVDSASAWRCKLRYDGGCCISKDANSRKRLTVVPATLQGFEANCDGAVKLQTAMRRRRRDSLIDVAAKTLSGDRTMGNVPTNRDDRCSTMARGDAAESSSRESCPDCGRGVCAHFKFCTGCGLRLTTR